MNVGLIPIGLAFLMPNWYLGDAQNAVDGLDIRGEKIEEGQDAKGEKPEIVQEKKVEA